MSLKNADDINMKIKLLKNKYFSQEGALFRYSLSYCLLLAMIPMIMLFFEFADMLSIFEQWLPRGFIDEYVRYLSNYRQLDFFSFLASAVTAGFIASKVFYSFMLLVMKDEHYELSLIIVRLKAFLSFLFFLGCLTIVFIIFRLFELFALTFLLLFIIFYLFYRLLSFQKRKWSYGVPGALTVSVTMMTLGYLFLWYVDHINLYQQIYGSFGTLLILYLSMYLLASIFYLGYCLNTVFTGSVNQVRYKHDCFYQKINEKISHFHL